jgi:hypothetical protein
LQRQSQRFIKRIGRDQEDALDPPTFRLRGRSPRLRCEVIRGSLLQRREV